ncbi:hypothetical protein I6F15_06360 [Bradyrhizobium sp. BRP14]|nr:hypothetical protein [Bradyrhizobium sp. BRP14]
MPISQTYPFFTLVLVWLLLSKATVAQPGAGQWHSAAPMPSERSEVAVAELDGKIYVVGGFSKANDLETYDPRADRWSRGAPPPQPLHHAGTVGLNGKLYVIGGYSDGWTPVASLYEYDPARNR